jgi:hypothetical protein
VGNARVTDCLDFEKLAALGAKRTAARVGWQKGIGSGLRFLRAMKKAKRKTARVISCATIGKLGEQDTR